MWTYQGHKSYEESLRKKRKSSLMREYSGVQRKMLFVFKENEILNCWRFEHRYEQLDGQKVHQLMARGEGPVVRHLCSDGRCVNQLHLIRGTDLDNAKDEIEVRDFEIEKFEEILMDWSMRGEDKHLVHLTLLPRVAIKLREVRGIRSLGDTNQYVREMFRQDYVSRLIALKFSREELATAESKLAWLKSRPDIAVITVPGK